MAMLAGCTFTMILAIVLKAGCQTHLECVAELKLQLFDWVCEGLMILLPDVITYTD